MNMSSTNDGAMDERVSDEVEALQAILLDDELNISENERGEPESIEVLVFPSTAEDSRSQYVCVKLVAKLPTGYPDVAPTVDLRNPRGLDEDHVRQIESEAEAKCKECAGQPIMFELIQLVREHLTRNNLPSGQCAVCLYGFREGDEFTKTECYHHFHSRCLAAHVAAAERYYNEEQEKLPQWQQDSKKQFQALCPVCRESINCDVENLWSAPPPIDVEAATDFSVTVELRELQRQMAELFLRQQQRGGIIDPEAEGVKMLLRTEEEQTNARAEHESSSPPAAGTSLNNALSPRAVLQVGGVQQKPEQSKLQQQQKSENQQNHQQTSRQPRNLYHGHNNRHGHHSRGRGGRSSRSSHYRRHFDKVKQADESAAPR